MKAPSVKPVRCAIYTRVSTDHGLDQEFNSLVGIVRKKLGLNLVSEQTDKGRVYRIKDGKASPAVADRAKQAA
jgi:hypothetical protein